LRLDSYFPIIYMSFKEDGVDTLGKVGLGGPGRVYPFWEIQVGQFGPYLAVVEFFMEVVVPCEDMISRRSALLAAQEQGKCAPIVFEENQLQSRVQIPFNHAKTAPRGHMAQEQDKRVLSAKQEHIISSQQQFRVRHVCCAPLGHTELKQGNAASTASEGHTVKSLGQVRVRPVCHVPLGSTAQN